MKILVVQCTLLVAVMQVHGGFEGLSFAQALFAQQTLANQDHTRQTQPVFTEVAIAAVGDLMLGASALPVIEKKGAFYPFENSTRYLKSTDIAIANLESPFTTKGEPFEKRFTFRVPPKYAKALVRAGFNVVTLANNHMMDYGEVGLKETLSTLDSVRIKHSGAGRDYERAHEPAILTVNGQRVAFFGYSMTFPREFYAEADTAGTAYPQPKIMQANIRALEDSVDYTVVSFHWSAEKLETPKEYQKEFAHMAIDSGADLVLGHHPHVLQGLEIYKNRLIAYSLGNFAFGSYSQSSTDSIILKVVLRWDGLFYAQCIPINVNNHEVAFQPQVLAGQGKIFVIEKLQELSKDLNPGRNIIYDSGLIFGDWPLTSPGSSIVAESTDSTLN